MALDDFIQKERWVYCLKHSWCPEPHECEKFAARKQCLAELAAYDQEIDIDGTRKETKNI